MCRSKSRLYNLHRENSIIETAETDRSQFWNILNSKRTEVITSNVQNDDWKNHFQNLLNVKNSKSDKLIELTEHISTDDKLDAELTEELIQVVDKTKPNKAPGPDGICVKSNLCFFATTASTVQ